MDDATRRYLLPKKVQPLGVPYTIDKAKILDLTKQMFDTPLTGTLQHAFESYVAECMNHIAARAYDEQFNLAAGEDREKAAVRLVPRRAFIGGVM